MRIDAWYAVPEHDMTVEIHRLAMSSDESWFRITAIRGVDRGSYSLLRRTGPGGYGNILSIGNDNELLLLSLGVSGRDRCLTLHKTSMQFQPTPCSIETVERFASGRRLLICAREASPALVISGRFERSCLSSGTFCLADLITGRCQKSNVRGPCSTYPSTVRLRNVMQPESRTSGDPSASCSPAEFAFRLSDCCDSAKPITGCPVLFSLFGPLCLVSRLSAGDRFRGSLQGSEG
jgi:hypothetical protein